MYSKNFLSNVILRADFISEEISLRNELNNEVKSLIAKKFPIIEERIITETTVAISNDKHERINKEEKYTEWHFFSSNREMEFCITSKFIYINLTKYTSYEVLKNNFLIICNEFQKQYGNTMVHRIGLRYIDQIEPVSPQISISDWGKYWNNYINKKLLGGLYFLENNNVLTRYMSNIELNYDDVMLRFQYGIFNEDYPAVNKKNKFIIDTDIYSMGAYSFSDIENNIDRFHEKAKNYFENAIKEKLRKIME